jgi:hypothetical protein
MKFQVRRNRKGTAQHAHPRTVLARIRMDLEATGKVSPKVIRNAINTLTYADEANLFPRPPLSDAVKRKISVATKAGMAARETAT